MNQRAGNLKCLIAYPAMQHPVRPSPALQCTPIGLLYLSEMSKNFSNVLLSGGWPSGNYRSIWSIPCFSNLILF